MRPVFHHDQLLCDALVDLCFTEQAARTIKREISGPPGVKRTGAKSKFQLRAIFRGTRYSGDGLCSWGNGAINLHIARVAAWNVSGLDFLTGYMNIKVEGMTFWS